MRLKNKYYKKLKIKKHCGKSKGPKLNEMQQTTLTPLITHHALSLLAAQLYDRSGRLLGPAITTMKVLLSRSCEIMPYAELDKPIIEKDKEFAELITRVLESCKKWKTIKPTRTNLIGENYELTALGAYVDNGLPAFGGSVYFLSAHKTTRERDSMIAASKSKVSKISVPANEAQARRLGMDIVIKIVECLIVDPEMQLKPLEIILYGDSSCVAALFNPTLAIKNSLLRTAVYGTIQRAKQFLK